MSTPRRRATSHRTGVGNLSTFDLKRGLSARLAVDLRCNRFPAPFAPSPRRLLGQALSNAERSAAWPSSGLFCEPLSSGDDAPTQGLLGEPNGTSQFDLSARAHEPVGRSIEGDAHPNGKCRTCIDRSRPAARVRRRRSAPVALRAAGRPLPLACRERDESEPAVDAPMIAAVRVLEAAAPVVRPGEQAATASSTKSGGRLR